MNSESLAVLAREGLVIEEARKVVQRAYAIEGPLGRTIRDMLGIGALDERLDSLDTYIVQLALHKEEHA